VDNLVQLHADDVGGDFGEVFCAIMVATDKSRRNRHANDGFANRTFGALGRFLRSAF